MTLKPVHPASTTIDQQDNTYNEYGRWSSWYVIKPTLTMHYIVWIGTMHDSPTQPELKRVGPPSRPLSLGQQPRVLQTVVNPTFYNMDARIDRYKQETKF